MKINTITCHNVYNYGATLQAYALQTYLQSLGNKVEIIDYAPGYHSWSCWNIPENSAVYKLVSNNLFIHFLYACHRWIKHKRDTNIIRKNKFDEFDEKYLCLTAKHYVSYEQLKQDPPKADIYIAGSDQIWNPVGGTGLDPAFYLNFGEAGIHRISYAASFGVSILSEHQKDIIKNNLSCMDNISVRESTGLNILKSLNINSGVQVLDPVFLLDKATWLQFIAGTKKVVERNYVLIYDFFQDDPNIKQKAFQLKSFAGLNIVSVNDNGKLPYADVNISDASPLEFLSLINNADVVISNSFHATAFSIILNKDFYVYPVIRHTNESRMIDLLNQFHLFDRYNANEIQDSINWININKICKEKRQAACKFLLNAINYD